MQHSEKYSYSNIAPRGSLKLSIRQDNRIDAKRISFINLISPFPALPWRFVHWDTRVDELLHVRSKCAGIASATDEFRGWGEVGGFDFGNAERNIRLNEFQHKRNIPITLDFQYHSNWDVAFNKWYFKARTTRTSDRRVATTLPDTWCTRVISLCWKSVSVQIKEMRLHHDSFWTVLIRNYCTSAMIQC